MSKPMNVSVRLTSPLTDFVGTRVGSDADYDNVSEYVRDLIRRDREQQEHKAFLRLKSNLQDAFSQSDEDAIGMDFAAFKKRHSPQST